MCRSLSLVVTFVCSLANACQAGPWSQPVDVVHGATRCVSYRARLQDDQLIIEAAHADPWHTYALDNKQRAAEKLAGKMSLGIEQPTVIALGQGLKPVGPWYQTPPRNLSRPEMRWYTWGFDGVARFVVQVKRNGPPETMISIRGQVCDAENCQRVDVALRLPCHESQETVTQEKLDLKQLVQVKADSKPDNTTPSPKQENQ